MRKLKLRRKQGNRVYARIPDEILKANYPDIWKLRLKSKEQGNSCIVKSIKKGGSCA